MENPLFPLNYGIDLLIQVPSLFFDLLQFIVFILGNLFDFLLVFGQFINKPSFLLCNQLLVSAECIPLKIQVFLSDLF